MDFQAARAYDEWVELLGSDVKRNFDRGTEWLQASDDDDETTDTAVSDVFTIREGKPFDVEEIVSGLKAMNGEDIVVLDIRGKTTIADYFVLVTGKSVPHMKKMMDSVLRAFKHRDVPISGDRNLIVEGRDCDDWMLVDCENIVVHAFEEEARKEYALEELWNNKPIVLDNDK